MATRKGVVLKVKVRDSIHSKLQNGRNKVIRDFGLISPHLPHLVEKVWAKSIIDCHCELLESNIAPQICVQVMRQDSHGRHVTSIRYVHVCVCVCNDCDSRERYEAP